jgi:hypothetical protein
MTRATNPLHAAMLMLRVELLRIEPPIWRRLQVCGATSLASLHVALQLAFGWTDSHPHSFRFQDAEYTNAREEREEIRTRPERGQTLAGALGGTEREFLYRYDGDNWVHRIVVEDIG